MRKMKILKSTFSSSIFFIFFIVIVIKVKSFLAESLPSTSYDSIFLGGGPDLRCYNLNNKFSPLLSTVTCRNKTGRGTAVLDCDVWSPTYSEAVMSIAWQPKMAKWLKGVMIQSHYMPVTMSGAIFKFPTLLLLLSK